jgi:hypothetical protein
MKANMQYFSHLYFSNAFLHREEESVAALLAGTRRRA